MTATMPAASWMRLDPRVLLLHPVKELFRYLPAVILALLAGTVAGEPWWTWALLALSCAVGLLRWTTTAYRITGSSLLIRRGVLNRQTLSVPLTRIRSVEIEQTVLHRLLGLSVIRIRTAAARGEEDLEIGGIRRGLVPALRAQLLAYATPAISQRQDPHSAGGSLVSWRATWARYAPLTATGIASVLAVAAFLGHLLLLDDGVVRRLPPVELFVHRLEGLPALLAGLAVVTLLLIAGAAVAMAGYLFAYASFRVTRPTASQLLVQRGALQQRQTLMELARVRGVELNQPLSLRLAGAASLRVVMTGLPQQRIGSILLCPPGPAARVLEAAASVVEPDLLTVPLVPHGAAARLRRYTRAAAVLVGGSLLAALLQITGLASATIWLLVALAVPVVILLAADRYRGLGHLLLNRRLVLSSGSLVRRRVVLDIDGIIGWSIRSSPLQRRAGLVTLIAATAAGRRRYPLPDIPIDAAWNLAASLGTVDPSANSTAPFTRRERP